MGLINKIKPIFFKMKFKIIFILVFLISNTYNAEEVNRGREIAENICSVCHGVNGQANTAGNSVLVPHLTAQNEQYLIEKLKHYKDKTLKHHQMSLIADMLTLEDIKNVARWYSSIKITVQGIE